MQDAHNLTSLQQVRAAVRANMLPGLVLWCGLAVLLIAYAWSPAVQTALAQWGTLKQTWGYPFSFVSYAFFAVVIPELLSLLVLRQPLPKNALATMGFDALVFGIMGVTVDMLYGLQVLMFGDNSDWGTIVKKMLFDQFVYSPVSNFVVVALLAWRDASFSASTWGRVLSLQYILRSYLPVLIAIWCVWIPGVLVVYFMPTALQFPVVSLVLSFWILIFKFMRRAETRR
jgi:hypothetical protein